MMILMDSLHKDEMDFNTYFLVHLAYDWIPEKEQRSWPKRLSEKLRDFQLSDRSSLATKEKHTLSVDWTVAKTHWYAADMQI